MPNTPAREALSLVQDLLQRKGISPRDGQLTVLAACEQVCIDIGDPAAANVVREVRRLNTARKETP